MNSKLLQESFEEKKDTFKAYIAKIKQTMPRDIYAICNSTLISNPYNTEFPKKYFLGEKLKSSNKIFLFLKSTFKFYLRTLYSFFSYIVALVLFKIIYKKKVDLNKGALYLDVFFLIGNINREGVFVENYFSKIYPILDDKKKDYIFLPRLYSIGKNPFKIVKFLKIINSDERKFLFEFELLTFLDIFRIFALIVNYPFKTLRLLQESQLNADILFNNELLKDIGNQQFDVFSRYIYGKNIAKREEIKVIYSWSEFQVIERTFNFAIRTYNNTITLNGCQFFLNYETYLNAYIDDTDELLKTAYHRLLVNGNYYMNRESNIKYDKGVSLRYMQLFDYIPKYSCRNVLLLGSYIEKDTKYMIECVKGFEHIQFKNHPAMAIGRIDDLFTANIELTDDNIYNLFEDAEIVISTASGTSVEAVACGLSVIIIASKDNLTANPLVEYGKGKIWDIAFSIDEVKIVYSKLLEFRKDHSKKVKSISEWYKDNFFIEPTKENILKAFELI